MKTKNSSKKHIINTYFFFIVSIVFYLLFTSSCEKKVDILPAYLQIDSISFATNTEQGTADHKISSLWVSVDDQVLGVYELPASIPILAEGEHKILVQAGISENGLSNFQVIYPHYKGANLTTNLTALQETHFNPVFTYKDNTLFTFSTDFESGNNFKVLEQELELNVINGPTADVFEGSRSARLNLNESQKEFTLVTVDTYVLPGNFRPVYLEINYKCTAPYQVWLQSFDPTNGLSRTSFIGGVNAKDTWNKIYFDFSDAVSINQSNQFSQHQIVFKSSLPEGQSEALFFWDNIKLLHEPQ